MKVASHWIWLWALSVLTGGPAWAAEGGKGASEAIFIGQIVVLMVVGRLLGEAMLRLRQPAVMGQLDRGPNSRAISVRPAPPRPSARALSENPRAKSNDRCDLAIRNPTAALAHRNGD